MLSKFSFISLITIFIISSLFVWLAGVKLTKITDAIDRRFHLGQALGGLILLAIVTNLPEIAIVIGASWSNNIGIATGNILGAIAIHSVVLVILDGIGLKNQDPLTYKTVSLQLALEGILIIIILLLVIMGSQLPKSLIFFRIAPADLTIFITWVIGLWLIKRAGGYLPWKKRFKPTIAKRNEPKHAKISSFWLISIFIFLAILTLIAGLLLEESGSVIATKIGWSGILFGATILALVTSLPEISTGLEAVKLQDYTLAISDVFGGNAFLPVLFIIATFITGKSILPEIQKSDLYLASLGGLLTAIYLYGLIFSSKRQVFSLGIDSLVVLIVYSIGIVGLFFIAK